MITVQTFLIFFNHFVKSANYSRQKKILPYP